jgi:hypothetical protein
MNAYRPAGALPVASVGHPSLVALLRRGPGREYGARINPNRMRLGEQTQAHALLAKATNPCGMGEGSSGRPGPPAQSSTLITLTWTWP